MPVQRDRAPTLLKLNSENATSSSRLDGVTVDRVTHVSPGVIYNGMGSTTIATGDNPASGYSQTTNFRLRRSVVSAAPSAVRSRQFAIGQASLSDGGDGSDDLAIARSLPGAELSGLAVLDFENRSLGGFPSVKAASLAVLAGGSLTATAATDYRIAAGAQANDGTALATLAGGELPGADVQRVLALTAGVDEPGITDGY